MENQVLAEVQLPGLNAGGTPSWSSVTNPQEPQALVDFYLNQGYARLLADTADFELALVSFTFTSTATTYKYAIPPTGYANIMKVAHVAYQPYGLPYSREFRPGRELTSWGEFQKQTGQGYLDSYSYGTQPTYATIDPTRKNLYFYPGSAIVGDTISVLYIPIPTASSSNCPTLVNPTDTPITPSDTHQAIVAWAISRIWTRERQADMAKEYRNQYFEEVGRARANYMTLHRGDTFRIEPFADNLSFIGVDNF